MAFEESIRKASTQSYEGTRKGDTVEEIKEIQNYIRNAKIVVPNKNGIKVEVINEVLKKFNIPPAEYLHVNGNSRLRLFYGFYGQQVQNSHCRFLTFSCNS